MNAVLNDTLTIAALHHSSATTPRLVADDFILTQVAAIEFNARNRHIT